MRSERRIKNNRLRRRRQLRRYMILSFFSVMLIMTLSLSCFSIWSNAKDHSEVPLYKYYTNIEVQYGDTLWSIAEEYCTAPYEDYNEYINEVMYVNNMYDADINAGGYLIVPYYSSEFKQ